MLDLLSKKSPLIYGDKLHFSFLVHTRVDINNEHIIRLEFMTYALFWVFREFFIIELKEYLKYIVIVTFLVR